MPALPYICRLNSLVVVFTLRRVRVVGEGDSSDDGVSVLGDASGEGVHVRQVCLACGGDPCRQLGGVVLVRREQSCEGAHNACPGRCTAWVHIT
jgi:hypothetical protein